MSRQKDRTQNISYKLYEILKEKIITLEYPPEYALQEIPLCEDYCVSRTPVREALKELERNYFIEFIPKLGNIVSSLSLEGYVEIFQIRESLELTAIKLAALNWEKSDFDALKENLAAQRDLLYKSDYHPDEFLKLDREFHKEIARISKNKLLAFEVDKYYDLFCRYNYYCDFQNRLLFAISEHEKILSAMEMRNQHLSKTYMKEHLANINSLIIVKLAMQLAQKN